MIKKRVKVYLPRKATITIQALITNFFLVLIKFTTVWQQLFPLVYFISIKNNDRANLLIP